MYRIFSKYYKLMKDINFRKFQNDLSQKIYDSLAQGYSSKDNEVTMVERLVDVIHGSNFKGFNFYSNKIHGSRSYVEFNYRDKPITKEMSDMIIISIASFKKERIYQKISFVQNKMDNNNKWKIDEEQLFLLKNFPNFTGDKGIFKSFRNDEIIFFNHSKGLGLFGLFMNPGEMILISAPLVTELQKNKVLSLDDIRIIESTSNPSGHNFMLPFMADPHFIDDFLHFHFKNDLFPLMFNGMTHFLNNSIFSRDIYDFVRNWTQFNIGEPTYVFGNVINSDLDMFCNHLLRDIGVGEFVNLPSYNIEYKSHNNIAVMAMLFDLGE
ncbi:MAG: hypothetical protein HQK91_10310 [Nitrospirae bacterium]|nr:hypothetical protein [Nitrospirota bacterium]